MSTSRQPNFENLPLTDNHSDLTRTVKMHRGNNGAISLTIPGRNIAHIERFFRRNCARDLQDLKIYPDIKEISEAEAMRHAMVKRLHVHPGDRQIIVLAVGDGRTPRVGALVAFSTAWTAISIDPATRTTFPALDRGRTIHRLHCIAQNVEDVMPQDVRHLAKPTAGIVGRIIVAAPHSHADLNHAVFLARVAYPFAARIDAIAMPCCVRQTIAGREHCDVRYEDLGVWSARSVIQIWSNLEVIP